MDTIDRKLLSLLQKDAAMTYAALADAANASASACRRRVEAMRQSGVIRREIAILDPALAGLGCMVFALVTLKEDKTAAHRAFRKRMDSFPEVLQCHFVTGPADYVVQVILKDLADYGAFCEKAFTDQEDMQRCESLFVIQTAKMTTELPL